MSKVAIIGGGAAGMLCGVYAARRGHQVHILEKNEKLGKKLFITGKGRCNVTNDSDTEELFPAVMSNRKFLYSAFYTYGSRDVMEFFEKAGVPLKTERGNRVFRYPIIHQILSGLLSGSLKKPEHRSIFIQR